MSTQDITTTQVVRKNYKCDCCNNTINKEDIEEQLFNDNFHICKTCITKLPSDLIEAAKEPRVLDVVKTPNKTSYGSCGKPNWRHEAAHMILYSINNSDDSYDWEDGITDLTEGVWAVYYNGDAESSELVHVEGGEGSLEHMTRSYEYDYRDFPRYITGVLVDGKLRNFITEWKLVESKEYYNGIWR